MIPKEQQDQLNAKLDRKHIASRSQSGRSLSYIESHHAIREANRIFGFDGWSCITSDVKHVQQEQKAKRDNPNIQLWYVGYTAVATVKALGVDRDGIGFGSGIDADLGQAHESAIKEAESDALKRALRTFGDQFGLALYDKRQENVETKTQVAPSLPTENLESAWAKEDAGSWLKQIGATRVEYGQFLGFCEGRQLNWVVFALECKNAECRNVKECYNYAETGYRGPN